MSHSPFHASRSSLIADHSYAPWKLPPTRRNPLIPKDISARSPIYQSDGITPRQSLDSRSPYNRTMSANGAVQKNGPTSRPKDDEGFEEVGLHDDVKPKRRTFFSRFGDSAEATAGSENGSRPNSSHHGFHLPGRKRGQSGQGAELGSIPKSPQVPMPTSEENGVVG